LKQNTFQVLSYINVRISGPTFLLQTDIPAAS